jgi:hypothetical protein
MGAASEAYRGAASGSLCKSSSVESDEGPVNSKPSPPMTLGSAAAAGVRLIVWCWDCRHQAEPDPAEMARQYGAHTTVPEWPQGRHGGDRDQEAVTGG